MLPCDDRHDMQPAMLSLAAFLLWLDVARAVLLKTFTCGPSVLMLLNMCTPEAHANARPLPFACIRRSHDPCTALGAGSATSVCSSCSPSPSSLASHSPSSSTASLRPATCTTRVSAPSTVAACSLTRTRSSRGRSSAWTRSRPRWLAPRVRTTCSRRVYSSSTKSSPASCCSIC